MNENNEIWVFLSHSNKDYEKVRQVRNMLEEQSLRPLMFFLHCLNDNDEIDSLIKREIDCRTRFILCDSENARKSHWVQKEVEYIKLQNRKCETIDLSKSMDEIMSTLQDFINKTRIFISYNREEYELAEMVYNRLSRLDFAVYIDRAWDFNSTYNQSYKNALDYLENSVVKANGYVIAIMNERVLKPNSGLRYELIKAMRDNKSIGKEAPNIIPIATQNSVVELIQKDNDLSPLSLCNVQNIDGLDKDRQCDEIIKRVITQLMTPGSIKVLADNLSKGIYSDANAKEAKFFYGLLYDVEEERVLKSESGTFFIDEKGVAQRFEPSSTNLFIEEITTIKANYTYDTYQTIRTFIVPEGVKGFSTDFMRGIRVVGCFELPESLTGIGDNCFTNCILSEVVIPQNVHEIGIFAFGHSYIGMLQLPTTIQSLYGRQFKDSHIGVLRLPKEWIGAVTIGEYNELNLDDQWFDKKKYGYLGWPSTQIDNLEFY